MSEWGGLLAGVLAAAAAWAVARPLWKARHSEAAEEPSPKMEDLRARKEALLGALRELEEDRESGRLGEEDYRLLRARLKAEAASVLREMDSLSETTPPSSGADAGRPGKRV